MHGVLSRDPSNQLLSRTSRTSGYKRYRVVRVVRVDTSVVESTKNIVEWKNASHEGDLERLRTLLKVGAQAISCQVVRVVFNVR